MNRMLRVPRSRGALSGVLLVLLGIWGALIAFVGPYFNYAYTPDRAWTYTSGRLWLEILPGVAAALGGLIVLARSYRPMALFGGWLAAASGAWFAVGNVLAPAWHGGSVTAGTPVGGTLTRAVEQIGFFTGLGIVIVLFAAMAIGRLSVISVRDARLAEAANEPVTSEPVTTSQPVATSGPMTTGRFARRRQAAGGAGTEPVAQDGEAVNPSADPAAERVASTSAAQ